MDPHEPLRDDVRRLGELLGETLQAIEGVDLYDTVERVRALAKAARGRDGAAGGAEDEFEELAALLAGLPVGRAGLVARAFSHFLSLANIAEQHHRIRRRRDYARDPAAGPQRGSFAEVFARLRRQGVAPDDIHEGVRRLRIELVLTAHPTAIVRRTLLQKYRRIADVLALRDRADLTPVERAEADEALRREVAAIWGTSEVRPRRPTPVDEVLWGLAVFEQTLWDAVPRVLRDLDRALASLTGRGLPLDAAPVRFGSWIGGDRDGNPAVTPEVTRRACLLARWVAADLYLRELDHLSAELSLERASPELAARVSGEEAADAPYRALLRPVRRRLRETRERWAALLDTGGTRLDGDGWYRRGAELAEVLDLCRRSLVETGYASVAGGRLADLQRRLAVFDLVLAPLDLRQEADRHTEAIDAIARRLGAGSYVSMDEAARVRFLLDRLERGAAVLPGDVPDGLEGEARVRVADVIDTFRMAAALEPGSLGAYVITKAGRPSDVLAVEYLQAAAGVAPPLRVVPLFETPADLRAAGATLRALFAQPWYRARLEACGHRQEVMVGYSDSAKEAGRLAAAWDLFEAQEAIAAACAEAGVRLTLFHGRGGSVGRGGGPTYLAIQSQPPGAIDGTMRVTEQGEVIDEKFGMPAIAVRTLEVYVTATLEAVLRPPQPPSPAWRARMAALADRSRAAYRAVVYEEARFPEYFRAATPVEELALANVGSRPARRGGSDLEHLRAIPWQFAWTQTRLLLASWLGVETALGEALARGERETLAAMYREWPFFRSTIDLLELALARTDERIAAEYDRRLVPGALRPLGAALRERLRAAIRAVLDVTGHRVLLEENRVLRRSIDVRNPYVDPINLVQIDLLRRLRGAPGAGAERPALERAFAATVAGIAAGLRNTG
ncbi:MAG TPA: phosphoenolpyruvate carboxylase [Vicinamibacterales bacterium]|nr:phosphoenolpyruvate carboxylase [Vicinamibacterales bacterium]